MFNIWLLLIIEIILFVIFFYLNHQDIMAPSSMMCIVFIFSTFLAILNGNKWNIDYSMQSTLLVVTGLSVYGIIDIITKNVFGKHKKIYCTTETSKIISIDLWKSLAIIILDVLIVYLVFREVIRITSTITGFSNIFYAYRIITSHSDDRTAEQYMNGIVNQLVKIVLASGFIYLFIFVNNVLVNKEKLKKNLLYLVPPVLMSIMTLITGVRTNVLRLLISGLIEWYILLQMKKGWKIKTSWKFIRILALSAAFILWGFSILQSVLGRIGTTDPFGVISNYAGAPIQFFDMYIKDPPSSNIIFGQETFSGLLNSLYKIGILPQNYSVHEEYRYLTTKDWGNVYTIFRRFVQDFGIGGMLVSMSVLSAFFSFLYNRKIKWNNLTYKRMITIIEYGYLYYIVALSSVDNLVHDYINIGTVVFIIVIHLMMLFLMKTNIHVVEKG